MAIRNVMMSIIRIPFKPMIPNKAPANSGPRTPEAESASPIIPFARPNCSLGSMVLIAAEYAGH